MSYTLKEAGEKLGVSVGVIRRFCNNGFVLQVCRNSRAYRILEDPQLELIAILVALRGAGLERKALKKYAKLYPQGTTTLPERKAMLETRKRQLWQELEERQQAIDLLERQIEMMDQELRPKV